jgi:hypothetical protein
MSKLPDYFSKNNLLSKNWLNYETNEWTGGDNPGNFKSNLVTQPADWHYRTKKITYNCNSLGYRCKEFNEYDWKNVIVIFGCSMVSGTGVAEDETISYYLQELSGREVVNLGNPGSSLMYNHYNNFLLKQNYPQPWAVVNNFTSLDRTTRWEKYNSSNLGTWSSGDGFYKNYVRFETNYYLNALMNISFVIDLWKHLQNKHYYFTQFQHTAKFAKIPWIEPDNNARDMIHPGPDSNKNTAEIIWKSLNT